MTQCHGKWNLLKEKWGLGWVRLGGGGEWGESVKGNSKGGVKQGMVTGAMRWAWTF